MKLEYGIFDAAKHNELFDSLLSKFELDSLSNLQIYFLIIQSLDGSIPRNKFLQYILMIRIWFLKKKWKITPTFKKRSK